MYDARPQVKYRCADPACGKTTTGRKGTIPNCFDCGKPMVEHEVHGTRAFFPRELQGKETARPRRPRPT